MRPPTFLLLALPLLLATPACSWFDDAPTELAAEAPETLVSAHTAGVVGRRSPITVRFAREVALPEAVGKPVDSPFRFQPSIDGVATWTSMAELSFQPAADLTPGATYNGVVDLVTLLPGADDARIFGLSFTVVAADFSTELAGLAADGDAAHQTMTGTLVLADVADALAVEKMLRAEHGADALTVTWAHDEATHEHEFVVRGINRTVEGSSLTLAFDGAAVGVDRSAEEVVAVPGLNQFLVTSVRAETTGERHIELRFSDPLLEKQDVRGLIRVDGRPDVHIQRDGSVIRLYSAGGWSDSETVVIENVKNSSGYKLKERSSTRVSFAPLVPSVRFATSGVILPSSANLTLPIEATNVRAIEVEAIRVYEENVPQFLQVNALNGENELKRVGKVVWKQRVVLPGGAEAYNEVQKVGLDVSQLVKESPRGLYRISMRFERADILLDCPTEAWTTEAGEGVGAWDEPSGEKSFWDYFDGYGEDGWSAYERREDPCERAFYLPAYDHDITVGRNFLVSDIGLIAKEGADGKLSAVVTNLLTATPIEGADLELFDYQLQSIARGKSGAGGMVDLEIPEHPFALVAKHAGQAGWLRLDKGSALATSHFDVAGASLTKGLEGYLYGERGIWRPGDDIFLTYVLHDATGKLPSRHPADFQLINPLGQTVERRTITDPSDGFYRITTGTAPDAPTGNYTARVRVGGATTEKVLRVEAVVPNRLKIELEVKDTVKAEDLALHTTLRSRWLHGAPAPGFAADIALDLAPKATTFAKYGDYSFDDPLANFSYETATIWEGELDQESKAVIQADVPAPTGAPGLLQGTLRTRVYEPSGAFSIDEAQVVVSPHTRYVGVQIPKGDAARQMLLTDIKHPAKVVLLDESGKPVQNGKVELNLYKIEWRWWWEKGPDSLAEYAESRNLAPLQSGIVDVKGGVASWDFDVKYPDWGRYLITARDANGTHRTGKIVYIDWPGWAGRATADQPGGASVLSLTANAPKVEVGQPISLTFPLAQGSRALVSLETGSRVLEMKWVEPNAGTNTTTTTFTATEAMAPGVYANVTVLQPYGKRANDAPIRLYGITPIEVFDPKTKLQPKIAAAATFAPESTAMVSVSEMTGRAMTYTLAVVDEGLLGLTRFKTPDAWGTFYSRKALGVRSWDLFDQVAGAYRGTLDATVGIGGDGSGDGARPSAKRFKPMVRYEGPFTLAAGATRKHEIAVPQYIGEVRVMVVAGGGHAFGAAEVSVPVKTPLMVLASLPRVLGTEEELDLPISVFALEPKIKEVTLTVEVDGSASLVGDKKRTVRFTQVGEKLTTFRLKVGSIAGIAKVHVIASAGGETAKHDLELDVRYPGSPETHVISKAIEPGQTWLADVVLPGVAGTNDAILELSRVPPLDLSRRLDELVRYPHGCIEQTTSAAFPQVYLSQLVELDAKRQADVEVHLKAAISRLRTFQNADGGFGYWPGQPSDDWGSNYAGHFLVEAERSGYLVPAGIRADWLRFQRQRANRWVKTAEGSDLDQAYRLYTLALAGQPDVGAMNRLREVTLSPTARWRLAAAYSLAGQKSTAEAVLAKVTLDVADRHELGGTFGSPLRDRAMMLEAAVLVGDLDRAGKLATEVSKGLSTEGWLSTQETAYALVAMARFASVGGTSESLSASWTLDGGKATTATGTKAVVQSPLAIKQTGTPKLSVKNTGARPLFARLVTRGIPPIGKELPTSQGLTVSVEYRSQRGEAVNVDTVEHGADLVAHVVVTNTSGYELEEVALAQVFAAGWQLSGVAPGKGDGFEYRDVRDDRVYTYFDLPPGKALELDIPINASYAGHFYLPGVTVGPMYDARIVARTAGQWVNVSALPEG